MKKTRMLWQLAFCVALGCCTFTAAGQGCDACLTTLPDTLPADTLFLGAAPDGRVGEWYSADVSFRVPRTTTPVAAVDSTTPPGLTIQRITVNTLTNLPPGLSFEVSQREFDLPDETDGCVRFCGTPLQPGLYLIEVVITARVFVFEQTTSFIFPLNVGPARSMTEGFTLINNVGCGDIEVSFENNVPSGGRDGFDYRWDFGNGNISLDESPAPQRYTAPGRYPVNYRAIVDTTGYFLTAVRVEEVACSDPFNNAPDLQLLVLDPSGAEIHRSEIRENVRPPQVFNLNLRIGTGNYSIQVIDEDSPILGGDKVCGNFNFNQNTTGSLTDADARVTLTLLHPVDTVRSVDTVVVYQQPAAPLLTVATPAPFCTGDTLVLQASYPLGLQWRRDSLPLDGEDGETLTVTRAGNYQATYTSPDGCAATSEVLPVAFAPRPPAPVLTLRDNLLFLADSTSLPATARLAWLLDGEPLVEDSGAASLCIGASGIYTAVVTDEATGCSRSFSLAAEYDPAFPNCISGTEQFDRFAGQVRLFPNPTAGELTVELQAARAEDLVWELYNAQGRRLLTGQQRLAAGPATVPLSLASLPAGMYWLQLRLDGAQRGFPVVRK